MKPIPAYKEFTNTKSRTHVNFIIDIKQSVEYLLLNKSKLRNSYFMSYMLTYLFSDYLKISHNTIPVLLFYFSIPYLLCCSRHYEKQVYRLNQSSRAH